MLLSEKHLEINAVKHWVKPIPEFEKLHFADGSYLDNTVAANWLFYYRLGGTQKAHMELGTLVAQILQGGSLDSILQTRKLNNAYFSFKARDNDTGVQTECARLLSASVPEFGISRAGDVIMVPNATMNTALGNLRFPWSGVAAAVQFNVRYNPATDTFEIHDGVTWQAH